MLLQIEPESNPTPSGAVFFAAGFRPFFLLAGIWAVVAMALWLAVWFGRAGAWPVLPPTIWHGHEMVFGFGGAAVGGFLLTAVPNWTGAAITGRPVALLTLAWAAGRLAMASGALLPPPVVAALDLCFLPLLAVVVGRPLIAAGKVRNMIFVVLIGVLMAANLLIHLELMGLAATATAGLRLGIWLLLLMIAVVGGRIVPSFTKGGLRMAGIDVEPKSWPALEIAAPVSLVVVAAADLAGG
ncbi:MAG: NnrS family protein, partial [Alphaproteobacteria bacterium]|nr:NnrS family protein [Alphaproteobacteria bacterium]